MLLVFPYALLIRGQQHKKSYECLHTFTVVFAITYKYKQSTVTPIH